MWVKGGGNVYISVGDQRERRSKSGIGWGSKWSFWNRFSVSKINLMLIWKKSKCRCGAGFIECDCVKCATILKSVTKNYNEIGSDK